MPRQSLLRQTRTAVIHFSVNRETPRITPASNIRNRRHIATCYNTGRAMHKDTLIVVEHVSRDYGNHRAVDDISFSVARGEVLGFLGPNGAGKTTTMHIICGVLAPTSGRVNIAGYDIAEQPESAKAHIGYLPEQPPLYPELSVDQYLRYCACLRRVPRSRRAAAVANARARCGLEQVGGRLIGNLSRGFQQRVGIAQAIIHSPSLVIMDEPTVGLDPHQIVEIRELITELGADHSVILSTHILPEAQTICDRVLIIHEGRLILDKAIDALHGDGVPAFTVALSRPPVPEELEGVAGVTAVQALDRNRFRISCAAARDTAEALAAAAARSDWGLYELVPEAGTLEQTFIRLTRGEEATRPAPGTAQ